MQGSSHNNGNMAPSHCSSHPTPNGAHRQALPPPKAQRRWATLSTQSHNHRHCENTSKARSTSALADVKLQQVKKLHAKNYNNHAFKTKGTVSTARQTTSTSCSLPTSSSNGDLVDSSNSGPRGDQLMKGGDDNGEATHSISSNNSGQVEIGEELQDKDVTDFTVDLQNKEDSDNFADCQHQQIKDEQTHFKNDSDKDKEEQGSIKRQLLSTFDRVACKKHDNLTTMSNQLCSAEGRIGDAVGMSKEALNEAERQGNATPAVMSEEQPSAAVDNTTACKKEAAEACDGDAVKTDLSNAGNVISPTCVSEVGPSQNKLMKNKTKIKQGGSANMSSDKESYCDAVKKNESEGGNSGQKGKVQACATGGTIKKASELLKVHKEEDGEEEDEEVSSASYGSSDSEHDKEICNSTKTIMPTAVRQKAPSIHSPERVERNANSGEEEVGGSCPLTPSGALVRAAKSSHAPLPIIDHPSMHERKDFTIHESLMIHLSQPLVNRVSFYGVIHDINKEAASMAAEDHSAFHKLSSSTPGGRGVSMASYGGNPMHIHSQMDDGDGGLAMTESALIDEEEWLLSVIASRSPEEMRGVEEKDRDESGYSNTAASFAYAIGDSDDNPPMDNEELVTFRAESNVTTKHPEGIITPTVPSSDGGDKPNPIGEINGASRTRLWKPSRSWWEARSGKNPWIDSDNHVKRWRYLWPLIYYHKFLAKCIKKLKRHGVTDFLGVDTSPVISFLRHEIIAVSNHLARCSKFASEDWLAALHYFNGWNDTSPEAHECLSVLVARQKLRSFTEPDSRTSPLVKKVMKNANIDRYQGKPAMDATSRGPGASRNGDDQIPMWQDGGVMMDGDPYQYPHPYNYYYYPNHHYSLPPQPHHQMYHGHHPTHMMPPRQPWKQSSMGKGGGGRSVEPRAHAGRGGRGNRAKPLSYAAVGPGGGGVAAGSQYHPHHDYTNYYAMHAHPHWHMGMPANVGRRSTPFHDPYYAEFSSVYPQHPHYVCAPVMYPVPGEEEYDDQLHPSYQQERYAAAQELGESGRKENVEVGSIAEVRTECNFTSQGGMGGVYGNDSAPLSCVGNVPLVVSPSPISLATGSAAVPPTPASQRQHRPDNGVPPSPFWGHLDQVALAVTMGSDTSYVVDGGSSCGGSVKSGKANTPTGSRQSTPQATPRATPMKTSSRRRSRRRNFAKPLLFNPVVSHPHYRPIRGGLDRQPPSPATQFLMSPQVNPEAAAFYTAAGATQYGFYSADMSSTAEGGLDGSANVSIGAKKFNTKR